MQTVWLSNDTPSVSLIEGHEPQEKSEFTIGPYQVIRNIGKGGMGEVFLAYDTNCGRRIALKRIREDLVSHPQIQKRFLKEARITSQLTHPSIIPIYAIHGEENLVYYTMPFVQGDTLKQILKTARKQEQLSSSQQQHDTSIPALLRIFLSICQAVAYAHSKGVLHRDLKPENIIVGTYGEVLILDWGLAKLIGTHKTEENESEETYPATKHHPLHHITHLGKVVGTIAYMAPERALGQPATFQTEVYSLGVILYNILTLTPPFRRGTLKQFRKKIDKEPLYDPAEIAPYRDVPPILSRVALRCLSPNPAERYGSVDELIHDVEGFIQGRSEWFQLTELNIDHRKDWEFQENVLITEHIAITRGTEASEWVSLMISQQSFVENTKIETEIRIGEKGHGIGFLLSVPETQERVHLNEGYCLWLGSDLNPTTKLLRSNVEVLHAPEVCLQRHEWYRIRIEKIDHHINFFLNDTLQFSYISHLPVIGTHVGILSRDADFAISPLKIFVGSQTIKVNCLAVPDAFLAHKDYATALSEYRRIGYSFPGRAEGREALFRAGVTLLEQARNCSDSQKAAQIYESALDEFEKLHNSPGAPLEYLGKALVYQALRDFEEEIKCFEIAFRRYPRHPLISLLKEQVIYRVHESSRTHRKATYHFILLAVQHLSENTEATALQKLFSSLQKHWEQLPFIIAAPSNELHAKFKIASFGISLAFWLAKPFHLAEFIKLLSENHQPPWTLIGNAIFALIELGSIDFAAAELNALEARNLPDLLKQSLKLALRANQTSLDACLEDFFSTSSRELNQEAMRSIYYCLQKALLNQQTDLVYKTVERLYAGYVLPEDAKLRLDSILIWAYLWDHYSAKAGEILHKYPLEILTKETTPLFFLYGCWLFSTEGREIGQIHFSGVLEVSFPRSWTLFTHFYHRPEEEFEAWFQKGFTWEKRQFYQQSMLFYRCIGAEDKVEKYRQLEKQEYIDIKP